MNVLKHELRSSLKSTLIWSISLGLVGLLFISIYPAFQSDVNSLNSIMSNYSPEMLKAVGVSALGIDSFGGFYSFCFVYTVLAGGIQALIIGSQIISKEGTRKTSDFLFTKPISRVSILLNKYLAGLIGIFVTNIIYIIVTLISANVYVDDLNLSIFFMISSSLFFTQILLLSIGFCIGCFFKKIKSPIALGVGIGSLFFALEMVANMFEDKALQIISPMNYIKPSYIVENNSYDTSMLILLLVLTVFFMLVGLIRYKTKDI